LSPFKVFFLEESKFIFCSVYFYKSHNKDFILDQLKREEHYQKIKINFEKGFFTKIEDLT
jgi:hypothetical protein